MDKQLNELGFEEDKMYIMTRGDYSHWVHVVGEKLYNGYMEDVTKDHDWSIWTKVETPLTEGESYYMADLVKKYMRKFMGVVLKDNNDKTNMLLIIGDYACNDNMTSTVSMVELLLPKGAFKGLKYGVFYSKSDLKYLLLVQKKKLDMTSIAMTSNDSGIKVPYAIVGS